MKLKSNIQKMLNPEEFFVLHEHKPATDSEGPTAPELKNPERGRATLACSGSAWVKSDSAIISTQQASSQHLIYVSSLQLTCLIHKHTGRFDCFQLLFECSSATVDKSPQIHPALCLV